MFFRTTFFNYAMYLIALKIVRISSVWILYVVVFPIFTFKKWNKALKAFRELDAGSAATCTTVLC